jgi:hypothetical protein
MNKLLPLIIISLFIAGCYRDISPDTKVVVVLYYNNAINDISYLHCLRSDVTVVDGGLVFSGDVKNDMGIYVRSFHGQYQIQVEGN